MKGNRFPKDSGRHCRPDQRHLLFSLRAEPLRIKRTDVLESSLRDIDS